MATVTGPVQVHNRKLTDGYTTPKATTKTTPATNPTGGDVNTPGSWIGSGKPKKSPVTHGVDLSYDIYSDAMGTLNQSNTQRKQTYGAFDDMLGNYDYDEAALRAKFDAATKAEYAAKRLANEQAQAEFADKLGDVTTSAMDINRANLANAVANGYSRGTLAAQQYGAMLGVQQESIADASKLVQEKRQLAYDEAAALAKNAIDAEQTTQARIKDAATLLSQIYGYDANAIGSALYGAISGAGNVFGVNKTVQGDFRNQDIQKSIAGMQNQTDLLGSMMNQGYTFTPSQLAEYAQAQGLIDAEGNPIGPVGYNDPRYSWNYNNNSSSGGYGSGSPDVSAFEEALDSNGQWTQTGRSMLISMGPGMSVEAGNKVASLLISSGSSAKDANNIIADLSKTDGVRFRMGANGTFYLSVDPANTRFTGSRKNRSDAFASTYGTAFDTQTPGNLNVLKNTFGYTDVIIKNSKGQTYSATQKNWENTLEYMQDYTFKREGNTLVCTNKNYRNINTASSWRYADGSTLGSARWKNVYEENGKHYIGTGKDKKEVVPY